MERPNGRELAEWIWRSVTVLLIPILGWLAFSISELNATLQAVDRRVTVIEASRFTVQDGATLWRELDARLDKVERGQ
jgi:hypothetical protein